ncbi:MAG: family 16 glycosylhydrolase [Chitinophagaceae bacterium]|jgi:beta-glucanase (GH16 family)
MRLVLTCLLSFWLLSCSKGGDSGSGTTDVGPSNLTVTPTVSTDNSGNVSFKATATNAVSYEYDFGNGQYQTSTTGSVTYKYTASGTYTVIVKAKSSTGKTLSASTNITIAVALSLVWSDEFNSPGAPDPSKWGYDIGAGGWGNSELQYYTNRTDNVLVSNGTLKIIAKKETYSGSSYTSARLLSKGKFSFQYGKVEVSAKLPAGAGSWPAIWMLGDNFTTAGWPTCGEIDIMEQKGSDMNRIYSTLHYLGHSGGSAIGSSFLINNVTTEFHKYGLIWSGANLQFLVDDVVYYTFVNSSSLPFNQNFFMILNMAMGGTFGGNVDPAFSSALMEVDYVRVYQ